MDTNSGNKKADLKTLGVGLVKTSFCQSDFRVLETTLSHKWNDELAWFFACWYKFLKVAGWIENFGLAAVKNTFGQSDFRILKMTISGGLKFVLA